MIASIAWTIFSIIALNSSLKELADESKNLIFTNSQYIYWTTRFIVGFLFLTLAILCSRVANKHYEYWRKIEDHFLKLASLRPYLAEMEKDQRINIHERLVDTYFGKDECKVNGNNLDGIKEQLLEPLIQGVDKIIMRKQKSDSSE